MDTKYKTIKPDHYLNRSPIHSELNLPQTKTKVLNGYKEIFKLDGVYEKTCKNRLWLTVRTLAATFFSFGLAYLFSKQIREDWWSVRTGKKRVILYLKEPGEQTSSVLKTSELCSNITPSQKTPSNSNKNQNLPSDDQKKREVPQEIPLDIPPNPRQDLPANLSPLLLDVERPQAPAAANQEVPAVRRPDIPKPSEEKMAKQALGLVFEEYKEKPEGMSDETFQQIKSFINDISSLEKLSETEVLQFCVKSRDIRFNYDDQNNKRISSAANKILWESDFEKFDLDLLGKVYLIVNDSAEELKKKFINYLMKNLKGKSDEEKIACIKKLGPQLIVNIIRENHSDYHYRNNDLYSLQRNCIKEILNVLEKNSEISFICSLYEQSLGSVYVRGSKCHLVKFECADATVNLLKAQSPDEYNELIKKIDEPMLKELFSTSKVNLEHLSEANLSSIIQKYKPNSMYWQSEEVKFESTIEIFTNLSNTFPVRHDNIVSEFGKLRTLAEKIRKSFPEFTLKTKQKIDKHKKAEKLREASYNLYSKYDESKTINSPLSNFETFLYIEQIVEILNSDIPEEEKYKQLNSHMPALQHGYDKKFADRYLLFVTSVVALTKVDALYLFARTGLHSKVTEEILTQVLKSNNKDRIQTVFKEYLRSIDAFGAFSTTNPSKNFISAKEKSEVKEVFLSKEFINSFKEIDSPEKLKWILETLPKGDEAVELKQIDSQWKEKLIGWLQNGANTSVKKKGPSSDYEYDTTEIVQLNYAANAGAVLKEMGFVANQN